VTEIRKRAHEADLCVVGGGMAGLCAAISAARHGASVVLMHDRPVFGGNASSECRVHICGADLHNHNPNMRETGILEELRLENLYRNPNRNFSVWDTVLYEKVYDEPNITALLNCSCLRAEMNGAMIRSATGWQLTTQTYHEVRARIFADCSGDAILAPLSGAAFRTGREAQAEYNESIAPDEADAKTMGMTCLFQAREYETAQPFEPPHWASQYPSCDDLPYGPRAHRWWEMGYWWVELGGEDDSIHDTEELRDRLLKITYGVWDHVKNHCPHSEGARNWALEWIQFLPAKRESRRYVGEHVLTQNDIEAEGPFEDIVAYGGWPMDDHHPAGFDVTKIGAPATIYHEAPSPYGIPYRSLFSRNVPNLMFAGRDFSCTHAALSSARVMGTGCSMGQAVGTAASLCAEKNILPSELQASTHELQQKLIRDDAYLPGVSQDDGPCANAALSASSGSPEAVRNGINRTVGDDENCWTCRAGDWIAYEFDSPVEATTVTVILDSALDQKIAMSYHQPDDQLTSPPDVMPKVFRIEALQGNEWKEVVRVERNHERLRRFPLPPAVTGVRFTLDQTWGAESSRVFAFYVD